jgi:predicted TIM-barrel fold metal-dependent hydrolase
MAELATCPNVYTKMSGLLMPVLGHQFHKQDRLASKQEVYDLAMPLISHVLNCFGTYRVMFASNFPMDRVSSSLVNIIDAFSDAVVAYDPNALEQVFHHNAKQFYHL